MFTRISYILTSVSVSKDCFFFRGPDMSGLLGSMLIKYETVCPN